MRGLFTLSMYTKAKCVGQKTQFWRSVTQQWQLAGSHSRPRPFTIGYRPRSVNNRSAVNADINYVNLCVLFSWPILMDGCAMHSKKKLSCCWDSRTLRQVIVTRIIPITFDTVKLGYRHASLLSFDSMCDNADELLFFKIVNNSHYLLYPLLPPQRQQHYELRERAHNFQLTARSSSLTDSNFFTRMLFKNTGCSS